MATPTFLINEDEMNRIMTKINESSFEKTHLLNETYGFLLHLFARIDERLNSISLDQLKEKINEVFHGEVRDEIKPLLNEAEKTEDCTSFGVKFLKFFALRYLLEHVLLLSTKNTYQSGRKQIRLKDAYTVLVREKYLFQTFRGLLYPSAFYGIKSPERSALPKKMLENILTQNGFSYTPEALEFLRDLLGTFVYHYLNILPSYRELFENFVRTIPVDNNGDSLFLQLESKFISILLTEAKSYGVALDVEGDHPPLLEMMMASPHFETFKYFYYYYPDMRWYGFHLNLTHNF